MQIRTKQYIDYRQLCGDRSLDDLKNCAQQLNYQLRTDVYKLAFLDEKLKFDTSYYNHIYLGSFSDFQKFNKPALTFIFLCYYVDLLIDTIPEGKTRIAELASTKFKEFNEKYIVERESSPFLYTPLHHVITELKKLAVSKNPTLAITNSQALQLDYPETKNLSVIENQTNERKVLAVQPSLGLIKINNLLSLNKTDSNAHSNKISAAEQEAFFSLLLNIFQSGDFRPEYSQFILAFKNKLTAAGKPTFFGENIYKTPILLLNEIYNEFNPNLLTYKECESSEESFKNWQKQIEWSSKKFILESSVYQKEILKWLMELGKNAGKSLQEFDKVCNELHHRLHEMLEEADKMMDRLFRSKTYYLIITKSDFTSDTKLNSRYRDNFINEAETFIDRYLKDDIYQLGDYVRYIRNLILLKLFPNAIPKQYSANFFVLDVNKLVEYQKLLDINIQEINSYEDLFSLINKSYRLKSLTCHPDKNHSDNKSDKNKKFLELTNAKDLLLEHYTALQTQGIPFNKVENKVSQQKGNIPTGIDKEMDDMIKEIDEMVGKIDFPSTLAAIKALRLRIKEKDHNSALLEINEFKNLYFTAQTLLSVTYSGSDEKLKLYFYYIQLTIKDAYFTYEKTKHGANDCKESMLKTTEHYLNKLKVDQLNSGLKLFETNKPEQNFLKEFEEALTKISMYNKKQYSYRDSID